MRGDEIEKKSSAEKINRIKRIEMSVGFECDAVRWAGTVIGYWLADHNQISRIFVYAYDQTNSPSAINAITSRFDPQLVTQLSTANFVL